MNKDSINKALNNMKQSIEVPQKKKIGRPKVITEEKKEEILKVAEEVFFMQSIAAKVGVYRQRISQLVREDKDFASSLTHARDKWIQAKQALLEDYASNKKEKDWRALKYLLTIADREYSERKYLTEAVANQDAKITMIIDARQLEQAKKEGMKLIGSSSIAEPISLKPFSKTVKNKGQNANRPSSQ